MISVTAAPLIKKFDDGQEVRKLLGISTEEAKILSIVLGAENLS